MKYLEEFQTVEMLLSSNAETRAVDAFSLALIKAERQMRKIFTHLLFQYSCFNSRDIQNLKDTLANNRDIYFSGFIKGIECIYPKTVETIFGDDYTYYIKKVKDAIEHRNKIFHGQLTGGNLSRNDLETIVNDIKTWCERLSTNFYEEMGYDGFQRNSYQKSILDLESKFIHILHSVDEYRTFMRDNMQR